MASCIVHTESVLTLSLILSCHLFPYLTLSSIPVPVSLPFPFFSILLPTESPGSEDSPVGSPCVIVNGNCSVNGQGMGSIGVLGPGQSPEGRRLSPLTSPLLTDAGCVRNDDDEEASRKVSMGEESGCIMYIVNIKPHKGKRAVEGDAGCQTCC